MENTRRLQKRIVQLQHINQGGAYLAKSAPVDEFLHLEYFAAKCWQFFGCL